MTPHQEAKEILQMFYEKIGFYPQAKACGKLHLEKIIECLDKNRGYTQCVIDKKRYEQILLEFIAL